MDAGRVGVCSPVRQSDTASFHMSKRSGSVVHILVAYLLYRSTPMEKPPGNCMWNTVISRNAEEWQSWYVGMPRVFRNLRSRYALLDLFTNMIQLVCTGCTFGRYTYRLCWLSCNCYEGQVCFYAANCAWCFMYIQTCIILTSRLDVHRL